MFYFFGTDNISLQTLSALRDSQVKGEGLVGNLEVVCGTDNNPNKAKSLTPVKSFALQQGLGLHQITSATFKSWQAPALPSGGNFDIGIAVSFGYFIPAHVISSFRYGGINMHPSLLPRHSGAAPIYHTLLRDDKIGGVSVIELHKTKFDAGRILYQQSVPIDPETTYVPLSEKLAQIGAGSVLRVLRNFREISETARPQPTEGATRAPKINSDMGKITWATQTAQEVWILWRALGDTVGVFTNLQIPNGAKYRVKLAQIYPPHTLPPSDLPLHAPSGHLVHYRGTLWVKCKDNWLGIAELHTEGKKKQPAASWANGYLIGKPNMPNSFVD